MKWLKFLIPTFAIFLILAACSPQQAQQGPTCNKPYILVGTECCLDKNDNAICDKDETEQSSSYTIGDLQADINKVLKGRFKYDVLTKSPASNKDFDFYTDKQRLATLIAERDSSSQYIQLLDKFGISAFDIKSNSQYIYDQNDLFEFTNSYLHLLTSFTKLRKEQILTEVHTGGEIWEESLGKQTYGTNLTFVSLSLVSEEKIYDNLTKVELLPNKIVEILQATVEKYELWYNYTNPVRELKDRPTKFDLVSVHYLQAYSIQCNQNLVITIYADPYLGKTNAHSLKDHIRSIRTIMLREAQAIIEMCEQRYDVTYIRNK